MMSDILIQQISSDLIINKFEGETALDYGNRLIYSALASWARVQIVGKSYTDLNPLNDIEFNYHNVDIMHTFAVNSFRKIDLDGIDNYEAAPLLAVYMGHVDVTGTEYYLHMTAENSVDIIEKNNAYAKWLFPEVPQ